VRVPGIHHVTAIAGDPQRNLDFCTEALGLRLVKRTVNFDDPGSYHFYFGDEAGTPGSIVTFFAWPDGRRGRPGLGQVAATGFAVPRDSLPYWAERLRRFGAVPAEVVERFGEPVLGFADPDGLRLELVGSAAGGAGGDAAIRRVHGVTLVEPGLEPTARLLTETLGLERVGEAGSRVRFRAGDSVVDVVTAREGARGQTAVGTVHHVAFRAPGEQEQAAWRAQLVGLGFHLSQVLDRSYFRSIYFREPGGVLFEIATDGPGFGVDERELGAALRLPPWLEPQRAAIEAQLPPVRVPAAG
jgi:glyoxalase family protein